MTAEPCRVPGAAQKGICAYAGDDGQDACGEHCLYRPSHQNLPQKDLWQHTVDRAMHDLIWATGGVSPDDPMVKAWHVMQQALLVSDAHQAWKDAVAEVKHG